MSRHALLIRSDIDLRNEPQARSYLKQEIVQVNFAKCIGAIHSREGLNHYVVGDALIIGSTGDHWSVARDRFDAKYLPAEGTEFGHDGAYRNKPLPVLAIQQTQAFSIERSAGGDVIRGEAGDWLMQYAPGDHGIVENAKFQRVYRLVVEA